FSIRDVINADSASTGTIEVLAEWKELLDDPASARPQMKSGTAVSSQLSLNLDQESVLLTDGKLLLQMPDTKARQVTCSLIAHPRHTDVYPEPSKTQRQSEPATLVVPNSGIPVSCVPRY